eukprot:scaffold225742_cov39-Tisochrysis_lutea.AAC.1
MCERTNLAVLCVRLALAVRSFARGEGRSGVWIVGPSSGSPLDVVSQPVRSSGVDFATPV